MIIRHGDVSKLQGEAWYLVEIRSEKTGESTIKRIGKALPGIFRDNPVEIFIPVLKRDLDIFELKTSCYILARSSNFASLNRLKTITGVVQIVTEGESSRSKAMKWEDAAAQEMILEAENEFFNRSTDIIVGSFVRILDGQTRDYCGTVDNIENGIACVRIDLKTRSVLVETPVRNLLNLSHVPSDQRVFYYCSLVSELVQDLGIEGQKLLAEDLLFDADESQISKLEPEIPLEPEEKVQYTPAVRRHSRQNTVTALVKKLIFEKKIDPLDIAREVIASIKNGGVKPPKNLFIVYCIIKNHLMRFHFKEADPTVTTYRDVIRKYGKQFKFSAKDISKLDTTNVVPIRTVEVCRDGRSKEAREKKKQGHVKRIPRKRPRKK